MPGVHKVGTIAFRPDSEWEKALIDERAALSGMDKKDFYTKSIIYSNICMVGRMEVISNIVNELQECQELMKELASQVTGELLLSERACGDLQRHLLATLITAVDIVNGAAYLFGKEAESSTRYLKTEIKIKELEKCLLRPINSTIKRYWRILLYWKRYAGSC